MSRGRFPDIPEWLGRAGIDRDFLEHFESNEDMNGKRHFTSQPYFQDGCSYTKMRELIDICERNNIGFDIFSIPSGIGRVMFVWYKEDGSERPKYRMYDHTAYKQ